MRQNKNINTSTTQKVEIAEAKILIFFFQGEIHRNVL